MQIVSIIKTCFLGKLRKSISICRLLKNLTSILRIKQGKKRLKEMQVRVYVFCQDILKHVKNITCNLPTSKYTVTGEQSSRKHTYTMLTPLNPTFI